MQPHYVDIIAPTRENAVAILTLTFRDVIVGRFKNPFGIANPYDENRIKEQQDSLGNHPERYSGYASNGRLVAFMKQSPWLITNELSFTEGVSGFIPRVLDRLRLNPSTGQRGIFGLVAADHLSEDDRSFVLESLVRHSIEDPMHAGKTVNVIIHDHDPLLEIALRSGFVPVGKKGEASGAKGLKQQRYQYSPSI